MASTVYAKQVKIATAEAFNGTDDVADALIAAHPGLVSYQSHADGDDAAILNVETATGVDSLYTTDILLTCTTPENHTATLECWKVADFTKYWMTDAGQPA